MQNETNTEKKLLLTFNNTNVIMLRIFTSDTNCVYTWDSMKTTYKNLSVKNCLGKKIVFTKTK